MTRQADDARAKKRAYHRSEKPHIRLYSGSNPCCTVTRHIAGRVETWFGMYGKAAWQRGGYA